MLCSDQILSVCLGKILEFNNVCNHPKWEMICIAEILIQKIHYLHLTLQNTSIPGVAACFCLVQMVLVIRNFYMQLIYGRYMIKKSIKKFLD